VFIVRRDSLDRNVDARGRVENIFVTIQGGVMSVKPTCFKNTLTKGAPKIAMEIPAAGKLVTVSC
jgi:hypothetical protein